MSTTVDNLRLSSKGTRVRLDRFNPNKGLVRGRGRSIEIAWYLVKCLFFLSPLPWPSSFKCSLLRSFGAQIGPGVIIKPRVNIHMPWKLLVGANAWIGEEVLILNFEPVLLGPQTCLSQRSFLCTGNHDYRDPCFPYRNAPIILNAGSWLGAQTFVGPGTTIGREAVVTAGSVVTKSMPGGMICAGNPCVPVKARWK